MTKRQQKIDWGPEAACRCGGVGQAKKGGTPFGILLCHPKENQETLERASVLTSCNKNSIETEAHLESGVNGLVRGEGAFQIAVTCIIISLNYHSSFCCVGDPGLNHDGQSCSSCQVCCCTLISWT